jgi:NADPH2:quinone reductase
MKAAVYYENGGPEVLKYEDAPDPQLHPKGVIIRVEAIAIEGGDVLSRFGGLLATRPHIVGYQAAGEIIEVGAEGRHREQFRQPRGPAQRSGPQLLGHPGRL